MTYVYLDGSAQTSRPVDGCCYSKPNSDLARTSWANRNRSLRRLAARSGAHICRSRHTPAPPPRRADSRQGDLPQELMNRYASHAQFPPFPRTQPILRAATVAPVYVAASDAIHSCRRSPRSSGVSSCRPTCSITTISAAARNTPIQSALGCLNRWSRAACTARSWAP